MPAREALARTVTEVIADVLGTEPELVPERASLLDYGVDSLELMEIGARLERALNLRLDPQDLTEARSVGQAIDALHARLTTTADPVGTTAPTGSTAAPTESTAAPTDLAGQP